MNDTILIVDDEREIADLVEVYLLNEEYRVLKYYAAKDALRAIAETPPDLAILDVMLPDGTGFEICRKIRENHNFPIIMLTAKDDETDKITGLTLGADDYAARADRQGKGTTAQVQEIQPRIRAGRRYHHARGFGNQQKYP